MDLHPLGKGPNPSAVPQSCPDHGSAGRYVPRGFAWGGLSLQARNPDQPSETQSPDFSPLVSLCC